MAFRVALTFDAEHPDRPHPPGGTERVLATLAAADARATFFLQGRWVEANPRVAGAIAAAGHAVGNHSHAHARTPDLTPAGLRWDVRAAERAIRSATAVDPRPWFRCPFGAGTDDPAVLAALARLGYREVRWDVDGYDWRPRRSGRGLLRAVLDGVIAHGDGAVVLLHPWTAATGDALKPLIAGLRAVGAELVRIEALETLPGPAGAAREPIGRPVTP